jgi:hypothetical protein
VRPSPLQPRQAFHAKTIICVWAMLGNLAWTFPVDTTTGTGDLSKERTVFASGGKIIRYGENTQPVEPQNTTISAVIALGRLLVGQKLALKWLSEEESKRGQKMTFAESIKALESLHGTDKDVSRA